jgi:excinuclease ABC subunit A
LEGRKERVQGLKGVTGVRHVDKMVVIDQRPIGRTPASNPATYTKVFDPIRSVFASTPEARMRGFKSGHFSFNTGAGRCPACDGRGEEVVEMHFLSDVTLPCALCRGRRFNRETLSVTYKGKNIGDVLDMEVTQAAQFFFHHRRIRRILDVLVRVGLGYLKLGQPATTLSGGEAQRVKLAAELCRPDTGRTVYLLDEPTTGLHFEDVRRLVGVIRILADKNNTVVVIEHNMDVIASADHIIDLGPEGGDAGGEVVAAGTPEEVAKAPRSHTGRYLRRFLKELPAQRVRAG